MRNLTAAEFSLAHDGVISPDLKRRSSSYYWQTAAQERSRHELICEKTTRWHILTFGSHGNYWELAKRKCHGNGNGGRATPTIASNMSYTNLAEMASAFETHQRVVPAARRKRPADSVDAETAYAAAMASINTGLQLDASEALADALAQYQEGADALEYMRSEGIGKRSRAFYETWALCEVAGGNLEKGREALKAGLRALPTRERPSLQTLAKCSDEELQTKSSQLAGSVKVQEDATGVVSVRVGQARGGEMDTGDDTVVLPPPAPSATKKAPMKREDIDYMLKWKPSLGRKQPPVTTRRAAVKKSVSPEDETAEAPRSTIKTTSSSSTTRSLHDEDDSSDSDTGGSSRVSPFAELVGERNAVSVDGATYAKLALVGRGGSSKVFRVLSSDGRVLALKRIRLRGQEIDHSFAGYANEITLLRRLAGKPGIVRLFAADVQQQTGSIHMVMEAGEADLATVLTRTRNEKGYVEGNFARLAWQQMLEAVQTIHEERIVHGDLKPANFLFVRLQRP